MKKEIFAAVAMAVMLVAAASCKHDGGEPDYSEGELSSVTVRIAGEDSRAPSTDDLTQAQESTIKNYTVLVFNYATGKLEGMAISNDPTTPVTVDNLLNIGAKRIVIVANTSSAMGFPVMTVGTSNYSALSSSHFTLDYQKTIRQDVIDNGLVMTGEYPDAVMLNPKPAANLITVTIRRIVAKLVLGSITVGEANDDISMFSIKGVTIQQANSQSNFSTGDPATGGDQWGGLIGTGTTATKSYLYNNITALASTIVAGDPTTFGNFFYVFPNAAANPVKLCIHATYDYNDGGGAHTVYFPIKINDLDDGDATIGTIDGTYVTRNVKYIVNIHIRNPGNGSNDPDAVPAEADCVVTVQTEDWATITQNTEW
ncbi:MAG: hypothetical protein LBH06_07180 [Rikenellaceae bacterium]|nr:hypothetical protein [Rikenellaceae bacterium]